MITIISTMSEALEAFSLLSRLHSKLLNRYSTTRSTPFHHKPIFGPKTLIADFHKFDFKKKGKESKKVLLSVLARCQKIFL